MDSLLFILKLLGVVSTAVFGILGTVHDFRSPDGKLTKWGKASVVGTIASVLLAVSAQFIENHLQAKSARKAAEDALESTRRLERIIYELNRTMQPIESISVFVADLGLPLDDQPLQDYKDRLNSGIEEVLKLPPQRQDEQREKGLSVGRVRTVDGVDVPDRVSISESSDLFPNRENESLARAVIKVEIVELSFYRVPIVASDFHPFHHGRANDPDVRGMCFDREAFTIEKSLQSQTVNLMGGCELERKRWENNSGKIVAIPDLAGSQLFIAFGPLGLETDNDRFLALRRNLSLNSLNVEIGNRKRWIESSMLKKHLSSEGVVFWEFRFPTNEAELFADARP